MQVRQSAGGRLGKNSMRVIDCAFCNKAGSIGSRFLEQKFLNQKVFIFRRAVNSSGSGLRMFNTFLFLSRLAGRDRQAHGVTLVPLPTLKMNLRLQAQQSFHDSQTKTKGLFVRRFHAGHAIGYHQGRSIAAAFHPHREFALAVFEPIRQQIVNDLAQMYRVRPHPARLGSDQREPPPFLGSQ